MTSILEKIFSHDGPLEALLPGYAPRPTQIAMAKAVEAALDQKGSRLMVEAGTGTGKSLAYLVAALLSKKTILVSTATKTLQDQLFHKDLPLALKATGLQKKVLLMKGRANYLCLLKAQDFSAPAELLTPIKQWMNNTETGDKAELSVLPEDSPWWSDLSANAESCIGQKCPFYSDCYVTRLRRKAQGADLLVINHALLCLDQSQDDDFGQIIPKMEAWILDEAHALEDVATRSFGFEISGRQVRYLIRDLNNAILKIESHNQTQYLQAVESILPSFLKICDQFGHVDCLETLKQLKPLLDFIDIALSGTQLTMLARRVHKLSTALAFSLSDEATDTGYVVFLERDDRGVILRAAPIEPAEVLKKTLWNNDISVVLTSATLAIQNSLNPFQKRVGLLDNCTGHILETPFDTLSQSALYVPKYIESLENEIVSLIDLSRGGAFLLFTSHRVMNACHEALQSQLESKGLQVFKQGDKPKLDLIRDFTESDAGFGGVLFATHSFWEGVDVQGKALRLVVIDKLPFKSPADPIQKARSDRLEAKGASSFYELSLPQAALALKQGVGRLLRTHTDRGVVAILDPRLQQKSYGKVFLDTLPPMTRVQELSQLKDFL